MSKAKLRLGSFKWHRKLAWLSFAALLLAVVSAITHPILSWTGPKAAKFRPPSMQVQAEDLAAIPGILRQHNIGAAQIVKLVPSAQGNLLQLTETADLPRRYFSLDNGEELIDFDQQQAAWLAAYYLGKDLTTQIQEITFQTEFDSAYPWVNRLLPVYHIRLSDQSNTSLYIYTELNALAGISNDYKTRLQAIFRHLHTWAWLNDFDYARIIIMALLIGSAFLMTLAGVGLLVFLRSRPVISLKTKVHRLSAYVVAIPLLGFCASGFYHLLHQGLVDTHRGMVTGKPISLAGLNAGIRFDSLPDQALNHVSLMQHNNELYYRLSLASTKHLANHQPKKPGDHAQHAGSIKQRNQHFKGNLSEHGSQYFSAANGSKAAITDQAVSIQLAKEFIASPSSVVSNSQLITRFGLHYDFRNKRLPVWQIDFDNALGDKVFIDPATGTMVDRLVNQDRYEGYSFSFLHKWNFLTPLTGRFWRDVLVVIILVLSLVLSVLGLSMKLTSRT